MRLNDLAANVALILDLEFPFSSMGVFHPALAPHADIGKIHTRMVENLE